MKSFTGVISMSLQPRDGADINVAVLEAMETAIKYPEAKVSFMFKGVHVEVTDTSSYQEVVKKWALDRRRIELLGEQSLIYP